MPERITYITTDGIEIVGSYEDAGGAKFAVLLHMMPATKESWMPFVEKLNAVGYNALAIDERGHGESTMNGTLNYTAFTDAEQQAKIRDVEGAFVFLQSKGATEANTVVIGASIGANLAIRFAQMHASVPVALALSPGLNFRGVETEPLIRALNAGQKVVLVASDDDSTSYESVQALHDANPSQTVLIQRSGIGHGTHMTEADPALIEELISLLP